MLSNLPDYTSNWTKRSLERIYFRYRLKTVEMIESEAYQGYAWVKDHGLDLDRKLKDMLNEKDGSKQRSVFNDIILEMEWSIKVLVGDMECIRQDQWPTMLSRTMSNSGASLQIMH